VPASQPTLVAASRAIAAEREAMLQDLGELLIRHLAPAIDGLARAWAKVASGPPRT
jgi:hypothetical protein